MRKGWIVALVLVAVVAILALVTGSQYNRLVNLQESVTAQWGQVENVYHGTRLVPQFGNGPDQRVGHRHHSDLVPQILLEPVHGCA